MKRGYRARSSRGRREYGVFALPRFYPVAVQGVEPRSWTRVVDIACALVCLSALVALVGWWRHIIALTSFVPGYPTTKVNTAIALFSLGAAVWLKRRPKTGRFARVVANLLAAVALVIAGLTFAEHVTGHPLGLDDALFPEWWPSPPGRNPGRMSMGTSADLLLVAGAVLLLDWKSRISRLLLGLSMFISASALVGYLYEAQPLFGVRVLNGIAVQTAITLVLLQLACFAARPGREPVASLFSPELGIVGRLELLVGTWAFGLLIGLAVLDGYRRGWFADKFAFALFAVLVAAMQTVLIWKSSYTLTRLARNKQQMEEVLRRNEKLAVAGRLAATISHEINNPLEAISNLLYLIQTSKTMEDTERYAEIATDELRRVAQITTQTLSFYRENNLPKVCDVTPIVQSAVQLLRGKMSSQGVEMVEEYGGGVGELECSAGEMRQVLVNVISNAMDATPSGGKIVLRVRDSRIWGHGGGRAVRVWLADSGCGMSAEVQQRIFEPFYTTKEKTGNGLGLWVAADLVQQQGGWIQVRSRVDGPWRGTTFLLVLPYQDAEFAVAQTEETKVDVGG